MDDQPKEGRVPKHIEINNAAHDLDRAVGRLDDFIKQMTGAEVDVVSTPPNPDGYVKQALKDPTFVEVLDRSASFLREETERLDGLVDNIRELLF